MVPARQIIVLTQRGREQLPGNSGNPPALCMLAAAAAVVATAVTAAAALVVPALIALAASGRRTRAAAVVERLTWSIVMALAAPASWLSGMRGDAA